MSALPLNPSDGDESSCNTNIEEGVSDTLIQLKNNDQEEITNTCNAVVNLDFAKNDSAEVQDENEAEDKEESECEDNSDDESTIPATHIVVTKCYLNKLKTKAEKFDSLMATLRRRTYQGNETADKLLGMAASLVPAAGYQGVATIIPFITASLLANANIPINAETLVTALPSNKYISNVVTNNAVDTIIQTQDSIKKKHVYISIDKGNKKGNKNLAKIICWYSQED